MSSLRRPHARPSPPRDGVWLLACLLALQVALAGYLATLGPAHFHRAATDAARLTDFRRAAPTPVPAHGADDAVRRHHHPSTDASSVRSADDAPLQALDDGDGASSSASLPALLACIDRWRSPDGADERAWCPTWAPLAGFERPLERPPKTG